MQGVHDGMDEMKARGVAPNIFTYFVLREASILNKDKRTATSALDTIKNLIEGDVLSSKDLQKPVEPPLEIDLPSSVLPEDTIHHWKGYYAPSDDDEW